MGEHSGEKTTGDPGRDSPGGIGNPRFAFHYMEKGTYSPIIDQDLKSLEYGECGFRAGQAWKNLHEGRWDILACFDRGQYVGVLVICLDEVKEGNVLHIVACKFSPGRFVRAIMAAVVDIARQWECIGITATSRRPLDRLWPKCKPVSQNFFQRI